MKDLIKTLGLAAVAATALMVFAASSASATALYSGSTKLGEGASTDFSIPSGGSVNLTDTEGESLDTCTASTVKGILAANGITGAVETLTWGGCTFPTSTIIKGKLLSEWTQNTEGTHISDAEIAVTVNTVFFGSCIYGVTSGKNMGTLTTFSSGAAIFHLNSVVVKFTGSNIACPETAKLTGTYIGTEPGNLRIEKE